MSLDDKIIDKIKTEIPDVIDEDDIKDLVQKTIEKVVFSERTVKGSYSTKKLPALIEEIVLDKYEKSIRKAVVKWLDDNPEIVGKHVKEATQDGFASAVLQSLDRKMEMKISSFIEFNNY